jgi:putrescine transport system permease protein
VYPRWYWRTLALPGTLWLLLLFVVPFYAIVAIALGTVNFLQLSVPSWNPVTWNVGYLNAVLHGLAPGQVYWDVLLRTAEYVFTAVVLSLLIGYPVAYYIARHAGRWRALLLILLVLPFWISYLMRMLAWVNLLQTDGYVNRFLMFIGVLDQPRGWLEGQASSVVLALVYGYIPYLILPLFAALDRIDGRLIEAARDLGANPFRAFVHVTLPLSWPGILAGSVLITLPMFGDYYTPNLISGSPNTTMFGNQIDLYIHGGPQTSIGASLTVVLSTFLAVLMAYYLVAVHRTSRQEAG